jgi:hypothetical protein
MAKPAVYRLDLGDLPQRVPGIVRLRRLLKCIGRYGFKVVGAVQLDTEGQPAGAVGPEETSADPGPPPPPGPDG